MLTITTLTDSCDNQHTSIEGASECAHYKPAMVRWQGYGAYIGSANLSDPAWNNNVEAGCFFSEAELAASGFDRQLQNFFQEIDENASPLTTELYELIKSRNEDLNRQRQSDQGRADTFAGTDLVKHWQGLVRVNQQTAAERKRAAFLEEWYATVETIRGIGARVSADEFRPLWVDADIPTGAQADQFLHAHYYQRTFEGQHARYERWFQDNQNNPEAALVEAMNWWHELERPPSSEEVTLNEWAPTLREQLSEPSILATTKEGLIEICKRVHAIRDHARRVANVTVGLPDTGEQYSIDIKTEAFARYLYGLRSAHGHSVLETIHHVLYGGLRESVPDRMWEALEYPEWKIEHFGISALGELVGWALPDAFPPRNGRTSKSLRSLGFPVKLHSV